MRSSTVGITLCAFTLSGLLAACAGPLSGDFGTGGAGGGTGGTTGRSSSASVGGTTSSTTSASGGSGGAGTGGSTSTGGGSSGFSASLSSSTFLCKIINNAFLEDPTPNQLHTRFNLKGTDLGVPVLVGNTLNLFFGDTQGYKVIWTSGEDPDSVAHIPFADVQADPSSLCKSLSFYVTPDNPSVAHGTDSSVQRDFAGAYMAPPAGQTINQYIAQPAGPYTNMPGTFEVPTGGLSQGGKVFLFYAGLVQNTPTTRATLGYLARWDAPGTTVPNYQVLRRVDWLSGGPLGGHFIQIAPVDDGAHVQLFGTGNYRHSGVYLARLSSAALGNGGGEQLFDPQAHMWKDAASLSQSERDGMKPLFETDGVGELSVRRLDGSGLYVALYQRQGYDAMGNINDDRLIFRVAPAPEGPWSDPLTVIDRADTAFQSAHCCGTTCPGSQILHCDRAWLYAPYILPSATATPAAGGGYDVKLPFIVSTWDPYNVVAFTADVHVASKP